MQKTVTSKIYTLGETHETLIYDNNVANLNKCDFHPIIGKLPVVSGYNIRLYNNFIIGSFNDHMTHNYYKNLSKYLK
ncbi:hypothetical protein FACS1894179_04760 [Bacteroidia bacterium]|nr:hypothetical protein FACS1894179_04760 [Bacteroidia bacterium]